MHASAETRRTDFQSWSTLQGNCRSKDSMQDLQITVCKLVCWNVPPVSHLTCIFFPHRGHVTSTT
jgi:hypothetical protein